MVSAYKPLSPLFTVYGRTFWFGIPVHCGRRTLDLISFATCRCRKCVVRSMEQEGDRLRQREARNCAQEGEASEENCRVMATIEATTATGPVILSQKFKKTFCALDVLPCIYSSPSQLPNYIDTFFEFDN